MMMKKMFVQFSRTMFNVLYKCFGIFSRRNEALFLSRQANSPSEDFLLLGEELVGRGWNPVYHTKKLSKKTAVSYVGHIVIEIYHLARCRICFLDRYDPVISLIDFACEESSAAEPCLHREHPTTPVIIQIWHAFGSFKCFGYQSLDTPEGHTAETAEAFGIHRNYSWVFCTGECDREAFARAFSYPLERVLPLCRPTYDVLLREAHRRKRGGRKSDAATVLLAPTLRKRKDSKHPFRDLQDSNDIDNLPGRFVWAFHPLDSGSEAPKSTSSKLMEADIVVTDYSSIVYEAALMGKKVLFYVPDIEAYRKSPGLNRDPLAIAPNITFTSKEGLIDCLSVLLRDPASYPQYDLDAFIGSTFDLCEFGSARRIADFAISEANRHRHIV